MNRIMEPAAGREEAAPGPLEDGQQAQAWTWPWWKAALAIRVRFLLGSLCLLTVWSFVGTDWLLGELTTHFRPHATLALLCGALLLVWLRNWRALVPVTLCCAANGMWVVPYYVAPRNFPSTPQSESVRILLANVLTSNTAYGRVLALIEAENPDILVLQETSRPWLNGIASLKGAYPYFVEEPRADNFGIAVYSRLPIEDLRIEFFGSADVPSVQGTFLLGEERVTLIATHPVPPTGGQMFHWRNEQLRSLAAVAAKQELCVLIGDLNSTPWSPYYREFERESGLRNARLGFGILPTWPVGLGPLGIPLDHCLVSERVAVVDLRRGTDTGGDHLPLVVDLRLPSVPGS